MNKETIFYLFVALVAVVVIVFINSDKIWNALDDNVMPLVNTGADATASPGSGSADPAWVDKLDIHWDKGNVSIKYAQQERITWQETFTKGSPTQNNVLYYWMNTKTVFIHYRNQEYYEMDKKTDRSISKDLYVLVPQGVVLEKLNVHSMGGHVTCEVEAKEKDVN